MSDNSNLINVGNPENPVLISRDSLHPDTPQGNEEWEMIADGSIDIPEPALDNLIEKVKDENK